MTLYLVLNGGMIKKTYDLDNLPSPCLMAEGIGGVSKNMQYWLEDDGMQRERELTDKPPYQVPNMQEIEAIPWNGYNIASTFSGCGGSCLGFRMAGFHTLWASEFIPAAREVYELNHPGVPVDSRDIRQVKPEEILEIIGLEKGQLDVLEGSPPCASFSTAGKREKGWGEVKPYSETKQRVDDLFFEFTRILDGLQPKVFVAENVSGLVKGKAKGYFKLILQALKDCGYDVRAKVLDAQWLGVPQARQRVIFMGVRTDLGIKPTYPKPLPYRYSVREAIPWIVAQGDGKFPPSKVEAKIIHDESGEWSQGDITDSVAPTGRSGRPGTLWMERQGHGWFDGESVNLDECPAPTGPSEPDLASYSKHSLHIIEPETDISRYAIGDEWEKLKPGEKSKKYLNLVKPRLGKDCPTVTQGGGPFPSGACVTHPTEKRKFSIAELKRICAFPDDFQLTGSYAQQWERLGRAVPPVMMWHVAQKVKEILDQCAE